MCGMSLRYGDRWHVNAGERDGGLASADSIER